MKERYMKIIDTKDCFEDRIIGRFADNLLEAIFKPIVNSIKYASFLVFNLMGILFFPIWLICVFIDYFSKRKIHYIKIKPQTPTEKD
jgi:hypothetical protein